MSKFFSLMGTFLNLEALNHISQGFPHTLFRAKKFLGQSKDQFDRYTSCPSCHKLYSFADSWIIDNGGKVPVKCSYVRYPNHVQARMRAPCGHNLLKAKRSSSGSQYLAPYQIYCYKSVIESLSELLNLPNLMDLSEHWRERSCDVGKLNDVYDGHVWQSFQYDLDGRAFLAAPNNYLLMLNCDWFQPFSHTEFSVGVLYFAVENLPRYVRFKREHILIAGIIPGPSEPSHNINTYLEPLINDLKRLWEGVTVTINGKPVTIRAALSCLACDVPAARKVGGFIGHNGKRGCTKCWKEFSCEKFGDYPDYSGFNKSDWEPRSHALHVWYALQQLNSNTEGKRKAIESQFGVRYSSLYELPYYNAVASCVIDPMHCLFLGVAKRFFSILISQQILSEKDFPGIQKKVDAFNCPPDIGRIPYKISSSFSGLKADQWKNWTLYFSLYSLKGVIPHRDYDCWLMFVKICSELCRKQILLSDLESIDQKIEEFCIKFENLYGKSALSPNIHLMGHITDCIRDHGPVYAFWVYAFERMNGVLGSFPTNNRDITVQLMRKFTTLKHVASFDDWPEDIKHEIQPLFQAYYKESGSLLETMTNEELSSVKPIPPLREKSFNGEELTEVIKTMQSIYSDDDIQVLRFYRATSAVAFKDSIKLASKHSRYANCSKVFISNKLYEINHFIQCTVKLSDSDSTTCKHWLVHCSSYQSHQCKPWYGYPVQVWSAVLNNDSEIFPLNMISNRVVFVKTKVHFGDIIGSDIVIIAVPLTLY